MAKKIGIIGLSHLGCVLSASWSKLGFEVVGFDHDYARVNNLKQGVPPIYEPFLEDTIKAGFEKSTLSFSENIQSLSDCDFIFLSYDTPVSETDESDTSILMNSVNDAKLIMKDGSVLIVSSQTPVGYCSTLRNVLKQQNASLELVYSPENLRLGEAIDCYLVPGRIILGYSDDTALAKCIELFNNITSEVISMSLESSELVKHGINSFLATSIVFTNNLSDICEKSNARIEEVVKGMKSDPRIGQKAYLSPGIGFSGGTLGRDLKVLDTTNKKNDGEATLFGEIHKLNSERKLTIAKNIERISGGLENKVIGILGVTYKPGTSTLRRSLPLEIVSLLTKKNAKVKVFDPQANYAEVADKTEFTICRSIEEVADKADILVLLTDWKEFKDFNWKNVAPTMKAQVFYDVKNCLNEEAMKASGLTYHSLGK